MKRWRSGAKRVISLLPVNVYLEARTQPGADIMPCIIDWCLVLYPPRPPLPLYQLRQIFQARQVISSLLLLAALLVVAELTTWSAACAKELVGKEVFRKKEEEEKREEKGWEVKEDHPQGQSITCLSLTPSAKPQSIRLER